MDGYKTDEPFHMAGAGGSWAEFQSFTHLGYPAHPGHPWTAVGSDTGPSMHSTQHYMSVGQDCQFALGPDQALLHQVRGGYGYQHTYFSPSSSRHAHHPSLPEASTCDNYQHQQRLHQYQPLPETEYNMRENLTPPEDDGRSGVVITDDHQLTLRMSNIGQYAENNPGPSDFIQVVAVQPQALGRVIGTELEANYHGHSFQSAGLSRPGS
jgi:hypothetical protein